MAHRDPDPDIVIGADSDTAELVPDTVDQLESTPRIADAIQDDMTSTMTGMAELVNLMRRQTALTERLLTKVEEKAGNVAAALHPTLSVAEDVSHEILDVLRRMDERQSASGAHKAVFSLWHAFEAYAHFLHRRIKTTDSSGSCDECSSMVSFASITLGAYTANRRSMERNTRYYIGLCV